MKKSTQSKKNIYELALLCINSPMYYAVYKDRELFFESKKEGKILDCLHSMQCELQEKRIDISAVYYARGPGNLSALKLAHTFLHTLAVMEGVRLHSCDSFALLGDVAIFAYGKRYFIKRDKNIECVFLDSSLETSISNMAQNMDKNYCVDSADFVDCACVATTKSSTISTKQPTNQPKVIFDSLFDFRFPCKLDISLFTSPCEPLYILPAV